MGEFGANRCLSQNNTSSTNPLKDFEKLVRLNFKTASILHWSTSFSGTLGQIYIPRNSASPDLDDDELSSMKRLLSPQYLLNSTIMCHSASLTRTCLVSCVAFKLTNEWNPSIGILVWNCFLSELALKLFRFGKAFDRIKYMILKI